jgi:hypothetical protein
MTKVIPARAARPRDDCQQAKPRILDAAGSDALTLSAEQQGKGVPRGHAEGQPSLISMRRL